MTPAAILPASTRLAVPWKNGRGRAAEVAGDGTGTEAVPFDWRLTLATIDRDGAFSDFTGVDRLLLNAGPGRLTLVVDGLARDLEPLEVLAFAGEARVTSSGVTQPTFALNLMLRRGAATGSLEALPIDGPAAVDSGEDDVVAVVLAGAVRARERDRVAPERETQDLQWHDAVRWSNGIAELAGSGVVALARIR
jgi:environmental stress-induced protein Ves